MRQKLFNRRRSFSMRKKCQQTVKLPEFLGLKNPPKNVKRDGLRAQGCVANNKVHSLGERLKKLTILIFLFDVM